MLTTYEYDRYDGFDIIGDIHGCADTLRRLLTKLGYREKSGYWQHKNRLAVFLGDIVDRGPHIREALAIVYGMVEGESAVCIMGNHEYNSIGYCTPAPESLGRAYLREHNKHHNRLIAETLEQFAAYPEEWRDYIEWFKTLPLFIDFERFRVVHACWDDGLIKEYLSKYSSNQVNTRFIVRSVDRGSFEGKLMDRLTRGTDLPLPDERVIVSKDGYQRRFFRTKFWAEDPQTYSDVVFQPDPLPEDLIDQPLSTDEKSNLLSYPSSSVPLFIGHYWLQGKPKPIRPNIACLDYSAVKFGRLVAYRYDGEAQLHEDKFTWIYVDPPEWRNPQPD